MVKVLNMFREFSMYHVKGYNSLRDWQKNIFDITYKKHLSSMPLDERIHYTEDRIKKIERKGVMLLVYFKNGQSYYYLPDKTWKKVF